LPPERDWAERDLGVEPELVGESSVAWSQDRPRFATVGDQIVVAGTAATGMVLSFFDGTAETGTTALGNGILRNVASDQTSLYVAAEMFGDALVQSLDLDGTARWGVMLGGSGGNERGWDVVPAGDGALYASGQFAPGARTGNQALLSRGGLDYFLLRAKNGAIEWIRTWGSGTDDYDGPVLAVMPDGGVVATSHPASLLDVRRFSSEGEEIWTHQLPATISLFGIAASARGEVTISGAYRERSLDLRTIGGPNHCIWNPVTAVVIRLDQDGHHVWSRAFASPVDGVAAGQRLALVGDDTYVGGGFGEHPLYVETQQHHAFVRRLGPGGEHRGAWVADDYQLDDLDATASGEVAFVMRSAVIGGSQRVQGPLRIWSLPRPSD
jgi:hypothetical protein